MGSWRLIATSSRKETPPWVMMMPCTASGWGYFALACELGQIRAVCGMMGIHPPTSYAVKEADGYDPEIRRPRERRRPKMPICH